MFTLRNSQYGLFVILFLNAKVLKQENILKKFSTFSILDCLTSCCKENYTQGQNNLDSQTPLCSNAFYYLFSFSSSRIHLKYWTSKHAPLIRKEERRPLGLPYNKLLILWFFIFMMQSFKVIDLGHIH